MPKRKPKWPPKLPPGSRTVKLVEQARPMRANVIAGQRLEPLTTYTVVEQARPARTEPLATYIVVEQARPKKRRK